MQYENGKHPFIKTLHNLYSFQLVKAITRPLSKTCLDEILNGFVDNFLPLKHKRVKRKAQPKWFNDNIAEQIEARDKLLTKAKKSGTDNDWLNFRRAKNSVTNLIRQTKEAYFSFSESWQDSRKLWNLIKIPDRE